MKNRKLPWLNPLWIMTLLASCQSPRGGPLLRKLSFQDYDFAYYQDGSGRVFKKGTQECLLYLRDASFKEENLQHCIYCQQELKHIDLLDLLSTIGFPRFLGSTSYELDFGEKDDNIVRFSFGNGRLFAFESAAYDGSGKTWISHAGMRPQTKDAQKLKPDMSLDEVVQLLGKPHDFINGPGQSFWWDTIEDEKIYCNFSPRQGREDKHVLRLNNWRPVPEQPIYRHDPQKKNAKEPSPSSTLLPPIWESEETPPEKARELLFQGLRFEYYEDGSGKVIDVENEAVLYETKDASYRGERLYDAIFLEAEQANVLDVVKQIGFPRFHGDDEDSLDFGKRNEGIVRIEFADGIFAKMKTVSIDGEMEKAWVMPNRPDFITTEQMGKVKSWMTVDEAVEILGKAHELRDEGCPKLAWRLDETLAFSLEVLQNPEDPTDHKMYVFVRLP